MKREEHLDLNEALQFPGKRLVFDIETELLQEEDLDLLSPISGTLEAVSTGNILLIKAAFTVKVVVECARCSAPLEQVIAFDMADEFTVEGIPSSWSHDGFAKVEADEPDKLFDGNSLVRDRYIRQGLLLSMPLQPLCSGGWDGECPILDKGASASEPTAAPTAVDPRLKGLSTFFNTEGSEN